MRYSSSGGREACHCSRAGCGRNLVAQFMQAAGGLAERIPTSEFVPSVMSSGAKRSRDICLRTRRTSHSPPDPSAPLGMTRGRPPVGMTRGRPPVGVTRGRPAFGMTRGRPPVEMTTAVTARGHENGMASRNESEFATTCRPHPPCTLSAYRTCRRHPQRLYLSHMSHGGRCLGEEGLRSRTKCSG